MLKLAFRTVDPASTGRLLGRLRLGYRLAFWPFLLLTLCVLGLALGLKQKEYVFNGPFTADTDPPQHSLYVLVPEQKPAPWWRQPLVGNITAKPHQSLLQLQINGRDIGPPHSQHVEIQKGLTTGFSHWGPAVLFSLPPGVTNGPETVVRLHYSVRPRHWVTATLVAITTLLGCFGYGGLPSSGLTRLRLWMSALFRRAERPISILGRLPYLAFLGVCCAGLIGSALFVTSSLYALMTGWALPTTAPLRWSALAEWVGRNEPSLGHALLMGAGLGAAVTWLAGSNPQHQALLDDERRSKRFFFLFGFPVVACTFVLGMSATWSGMVRPGDLHISSLGGLLPMIDAQAHNAFSYDQVRTGVWEAWVLKRPLAGAFRSALLFLGNYSIPAMMLVQALLLAAATCFATYSVIAWRGVWAGLAFFGLIYIYLRVFIPTTLSEPLGLFWSLLSVPFFIESFRHRSTRAALVAFALTCFALMTRMGSMFTIPALIVWLIWQFGHGLVGRLRIAAMAIGILLGVFLLNTLLVKSYGVGSALIGSNFSYQICGLTVGTTWEGCLTKLEARGERLPADEVAAARQLYLMAWENFQAQPTVFFKRLATSVGTFATQFPSVIWNGYGVFAEPLSGPQKVLAGCALAGLLYFAVYRATFIELTFWILLWLSIAASASVVYFDDGPRTLAVSQPLIALFLSLSMSNAAVLARKPDSSGPTPSRFGAAGLIAASVLLVSLPGLSHRLSTFARLGDGVTPKEDEALVYGGRMITGFLVVDDGQPLPKEVPAIHLSNFAGDLKLGDTEAYQSVIHPKMPPLPFGFVFAPRIEKGVFSASHFIVPPYVLERRDVPAWRFHLQPWRHAPNERGQFWFYVSKAEPWNR